MPSMEMNRNERLYWLYFMIYLFSNINYLFVTNVDADPHLNLLIQTIQTNNPLFKKKQRNLINIVWSSWFFVSYVLTTENGYVRRWQTKLLLSRDPGDWGKVLQDFGRHWEGKCPNVCTVIWVHTFAGTDFIYLFIFYLGQCNKQKNH